MSCKPFNKSEDNAKSYLRTKGAIDKFLNIIDINKFRINVNTLTKQAKDKYNIDKGPLFTERTIMSKEKSYYQAVSNDEAFIAINKVSKPNIYFQLEEPKVNFDLKVVNKLQSNISKVNGWFKQMKDTDAFWKKVQSDLAIPKEQVELLRQSEGDTIEQKLVDFVSKYSYTVEVNTAKRGGISETPEWMDEELPEVNSDFYSNLTVPGGTNYTENEISTPGITPSIKGHAQFATDKGIGWFRSDDKTRYITEEERSYMSYDDPNYTKLDGEATKTRRILELQSDLFQKGRDKNNLISHNEFDEYKESNFNVNGKDYSTPGGGYFFEDGETINRYEFIAAYRAFEDTLKKDDKTNQFLQLLNKDSNWVTFFIKSIVQDSAKKGYEKVLFPTGETAAKVEGHETLSTELNRINKQIDIVKNDPDPTDEERFDALQKLEKRKSDLKSQGIEKLKPIESFYENKVTNILKKNYKVNQITDEYGNTWNEVVLSEKDLSNILLQTKTTVSKKNEQLEQDLKEYATIIGVKVEFVDSLIERFGQNVSAAYDSINKVIYINENKAGLDTFPEEMAHVITLALGEDNFLVKKAFNLLSKTDYKSTLDPEYVKLYKNNESALKHEVLGKIIAKVLVKKYEPKTEPEVKLFGAIMQMWNKFISLFKRNDRIQANIESIANELASKITNKEVIQFSDVTPDNQVYFQVDSKKKTTKIDDSTKKQYVYLKQELKREEKALGKLNVDSDEYKTLKDKITNYKSELEKLVATGNKSIIINLGNELLDGVELMLNDVEDITINRKLTNNDIAATETMLNKFSDFQGLSERSLGLKQRLVPVIQKFIEDEVLSRKGENEELDKSKILGKNTDVSKLTQLFGKLSNSENYIARTIGSMISEVQSKVSSENKKVVDDIKGEVELLREYSKANGISEANMYDVFIQKHKGGTILTREYSEEFYEMLNKSFKMDKQQGKEYRSTFASYNADLKQFTPKSTKYLNKNYKTIQSTPALKRFYNFHKKVMHEAADKLPTKLDPNFIANIASNTLLDAFKVNEGSKMANLIQIASNLTGIDIKQFEDGTYALDEDLFQDLIPLKFIAGLDADKKSGNLGDNLATFYKFANSYEQMSEILPTVRTMQNQLGRQSFVKSGDPTKAIAGEETNIYNYVKTVINMQVKGEMKKSNENYEYKSVDKDGNPVTKVVPVSKILDFGMKYNSLLRIGLNPLNAITNVLVGDFGNIIEAFGGRFYGFKDLVSATNIFNKNVFDEESDLQKWRDSIGPLQELDDYETVEQVSTGKRITKEKVEQAMYALQKGGETFLQTRTMIAMLIKEGYMDSSGKTTNKGKNISEKDLKQFINKVHEVNNKIHGRYSARDAATIQQNVLARMALQFKKWIPAALESRFESKHFNVNLDAEVEGRYKTGWRLMLRALKGDLKALQAGNMTELELYNMKKNLAEITIALASILSLIALGAFGDDDEELKKNPYYKFTMNQLDRISGDLLYFVNPGSYTQTALKPIALAKTTQDVILCVTAFPHIFGLQGKKDTYQSGERAGENKFLGKLVDLTPIAAPIAKVARSYKDVKYKSPK